jgi:poly(3-hydroxybutyrate) depolymerase
MQGRADPPAASEGGAGVPTIVIHGDADATVAPSNGGAIVAQSLQAYARSATALQRHERAGQAPDGTPYTRTDHVDADGRHRIEEWVVRGGGHAWFGGSADGSYTDTGGPDASAEIVRFFLGSTGRLSD